MKYCHRCLKRIWFWESRAEGRHIKCLPIKERCKYYHIQRDITMSAFIAAILSVIIGVSLIDVINTIEYVTIGVTVCIFLFSNFVAYKIREREEDERSRREEKRKIENS